MARPGYVYVMSNEAAPGVVKIGKTGRDPHVRLRNINQALGVVPGLPGFVLEFWVRTADYDLVEMQVHAALASRRIRANREMFEIGLDEVRTVLEAVAGCRIERVPDAWPWARPRRVKRKSNKYIGGGATFVYLYKRYHAMQDRLRDPAFSWPVMAYEIGLHEQKVRGRFKPPPPDIVRQIWDKVARAVDQYGWDEHAY